MSRLKPPYGTTAELAAAVVQERDLAYDTTLDRFVMGDGVEAAGKPLAFQSDISRDALEFVVSPSQITGNQNDYSPTDLDDATILRITSDDERTITGIVAQSANRRLTIQNIGLFGITFSDESASSTAANRFAWPYDRDIVLAPGESLCARYDGTLARWVLDSVLPIQVIDRSAAGGAGNFKYALGNDGSTDAPDFAVDMGASQTKTLAKSILIADPGDTPEIGFKIADGTAASPSDRAAPYPGFYLYGWPLDDTSSYTASLSPYANAAVYGGRNAQFYMPIIEDPTQTARGGAFVLGVTKVGTRTPIDRWSCTGASAAPGFNVWYGRAFEDSGISYPYDPDSYDIEADFSPMSGINWYDFTPPALHTYLCHDLANGGILGFLNNTSVTNGHIIKYEKSSNELWGYRRVSGTDSTLWRFGFASGFCDFGFAGTTAPALRAQAISSQVDHVEVRGGDGSSHPQILIDGSTTNVNLRLKAKGSGQILVDDFPLRVTLPTAGTLLTLECGDAGATAGPNLSLYRPSASPAASDIMGSITFDGKDDGGNDTIYARIRSRLEDPTGGAEYGSLILGVMQNATLTDKIIITGTAMYPAVSNGIALGTSSAHYSDAFFASGAVLNWNNGDVTLTHSSNALAFAGASSGYAFDAVVDLSGASAGQIKFPATQNASSDANTLDDYEEGTWTPAVTFDTAGDLSVTYSTQSGTYTKIGRMVQVTGTLVTSAFTHSTASGDLRITGLPFAAGVDTAAGIGRLRGVTKASYTHFGVRIDTSLSYAVIIASGSGVAPSSVDSTNVASGGTVHIQFSLTYNV